MHVIPHIKALLAARRSPSSTSTRRRTRHGRTRRRHRRPPPHRHPRLRPHLLKRDPRRPRRIRLHQRLRLPRPRPRRLRLPRGRPRHGGPSAPPAPLVAAPTHRALQVSLVAEANRLLALAEAGAKKQARATKAARSGARFPQGIEYELIHADTIILLGLTNAIRSVPSPVPRPPQLDAPLTACRMDRSESYMGYLQCL